MLQELRSVKSQAYFILQLGYFKAKHLFFNFDFDEVEEDTHFLLDQHFDGRHLDDPSAVDNQTRSRQQHLILELFKHRTCDAQERHNLNKRAQQAAALLKHVSPVAWQHINFYGRYEFGNQPDAINLDEIIRDLVRARFESELMPTA